MISIIAGVLTYATFVAGLSALLIPGYMIFSANGRARLRARHRAARFIAGLTTIQLAPTPNKEIPMRKIITISAIVVGAFVAIGIGMAAASSGGTPAPTVAQPTVTLPDAPVTSAAPVDIQSKCVDIITTGEAKHVAMVADRDAAKKWDDTMDALLKDSHYGTPEHDALETANDEAEAAKAITSANLDTVRTNFRAASTAAITTACSKFNTIDGQFINADLALMSATPTTQAAADQLWANAQAAWDAAKSA